MQLKEVQSSQINAIGYAPATNTMRIAFKSGGLYEYANVTPEVFEAFEKAPSIGSHFYKHIKPFADKYPYVKLENNQAIEAAAPERTDTTITPATGTDQPAEAVTGKNSDDTAVVDDPSVEEHEQPGGGGL